MTSRPDMKKRQDDLHAITRRWFEAGATLPEVLNAYAAYIALAAAGQPTPRVAIETFHKKLDQAFAVAERLVGPNNKESH